MANATLKGQPKENEIRVAGLSLPLFAIVATIVLAAGFFTFGPKGDKILLPANMIGAFAFMMVLGAILNEVGNRVPIVNTFLGGGPIVIIFGVAALVYYKIMPAATIKLTGDFMAAHGFLDFYIAALITGSILGMNRDLLVKAFARYIPAILGGVVMALTFVGIGGAVLGYGWQKAILFIGVPIMGGGMGAGAVPLANIYSGGNATEAARLLSMMIPAVALGNTLSIISAGLLNRLGKAKPQFSGNGQLMVTKDESILKTDVKAPLSLEMMGIGLLLATTFFIVGLGLEKLIPSIHAFALMIITVAIVKVLGLLPAYYEQCAHQWFQFIMTNLTGVLLVGIGVKYTNLGEIIAAFTLQYIVLVFLVIAGAILGSGLVSKLVGFHPIEGAITAGLCMSNMGGTGDVATLSAAKRMELMPFAQISSRIGGAMMLILGGLLISALL